MTTGRMAGLRLRLTRGRFADWSAIAAWRAEIGRYCAHKRQLRDLRRLDGRLLRDVGISREEAALGRPVRRRP